METVIRISIEHTRNSRFHRANSWPGIGARVRKRKSRETRQNRRDSELKDQPPSVRRL